MTLEEAIEHAEARSSDDVCGQDHRQLAAWLRELQTLKAVYNEKQQLRWMLITSVTLPAKGRRNRRSKQFIKELVMPFVPVHGALLANLIPDYDMQLWTIVETYYRVAWQIFDVVVEMRHPLADVDEFDAMCQAFTDAGWSR